MKKILFSVLVSMFTACATTAPANPPVGPVGLTLVQAENLVYVRDEINESILIQASKLSLLAATKDVTHINIIINSPGGMVFFGDFFINAMKAAQARGIKLVCVVPTMAASMAFSIFNECDERYALSKAKLLFHPVRTQIRGYVTAYDMVPVVQELAQDDLNVMRSIKERTGLPEQELIVAFMTEKFWDAEELEKSCTKPYMKTVPFIVDAIPDLYNYLNIGSKPTGVMR